VVAGKYHSVGLKIGGKVMAVGKNSYGQCDVNNWKYIKARTSPLTVIVLPQD